MSLDTFVKAVIILGLPETPFLLNIANFRPRTVDGYNRMWLYLCNAVIENYGENIPEHVTRVVLDNFSTFTL